MGMNVGTAQGGARRRGRRGRGTSVMSEINVTPLVDVMLVLLIVFMVAAPLLTVGIPIDLPETQAQAMQPQKDPVMISVSVDGEIFLGKAPVTADMLLTSVAQLAAPESDARIYVRGDTAAQYGVVMKVMGALSGAGYAHIGLITAQDTER